jgi:hypothetical protein
MAHMIKLSLTILMETIQKGEFWSILHTLVRAHQVKGAGCEQVQIPIDTIFLEVVTP